MPHVTRSLEPYLRRDGTKPMLGNFDMASFNILNFTIDQLEGIISDVQHGTKTTIPNAHHPKSHFHWFMQQTRADATEKTISNLSYVELDVAANWYVWASGVITKITLSMALKMDGNLASRGCTLKIGCREQGFGDTIFAEYHMCESLSGWKAYTWSAISIPSPAYNVKVFVDWKCDDVNYAIYSKDRSLIMSNLYYTKSN